MTVDVQAFGKLLVSNGRTDNSQTLAMCGTMHVPSALTTPARDYDKHWWRINGSQSHDQWFLLRVENNNPVCFSLYFFFFLLFLHEGKINAQLVYKRRGFILVLTQSTKVVALPL